MKKVIKVKKEMKVRIDIKWSLCGTEVEGFYWNGSHYFEREEFLDIFGFLVAHDGFYIFNVEGPADEG